MSHYLAVTGGRAFDDIDRVRYAFWFWAQFYDDVRLMHGDALSANDSTTESLLSVWREMAEVVVLWTSV